MIDSIEAMMRKLPPVTGRNAGVACVVGFVFGGLGLAIYFRNVVDFFFPLGLALVAAVLIGTLADPDLAFIAGCIISALYGYFRVTFSETVTTGSG